MNVGRRTLAWMCLDARRYALARLVAALVEPVAPGIAKRRPVAVARPWRTVAIIVVVVAGRVMVVGPAVPPSIAERRPIALLRPWWTLAFFVLLICVGVTRACLGVASLHGRLFGSWVGTTDRQYRDGDERRYQQGGEETEQIE